VRSISFELLLVYFKVTTVSVMRVHSGRGLAILYTRFGCRVRIGRSAILGTNRLGERPLLSVRADYPAFKAQSKRKVWATCCLLFG